ncbi:RHS repeat-associated core domain protein [Thalassoporum mexicanum PCC 7367]|uniref:putative Ig domain-containing protein n=1 Tax=Thalassoporum mexicanum TaxID=3457544 RepID=UPI00029F9B48|nr:putative Ig domain-containing protein [Pseudanabaena sp. PCC 7367]AFY70885.1 RHS repeat-associated core domain protein [Pseudanabaena sp. PCC 7367]
MQISNEALLANTPSLLDAATLGNPLLDASLDAPLKYPSRYKSGSQRNPLQPNSPYLDLGNGSNINGLAGITDDLLVPAQSRLTNPTSGNGFGDRIPTFNLDDEQIAPISAGSDLSLQVQESLSSSPESSELSSPPLSSSPLAASAVTSIPEFAIKAEGRITINNGGDFDGAPLDTSDDALVYGKEGFTINKSATLPVERDSQGNPVLDSEGKPILVPFAVAVSEGYNVANAPNNPYSNLLPPQIVDPQTVDVPGFNTVKDQELADRIPAGITPIVFDRANQFNNTNNWNQNFPAGGTADNPTVVEITNGGLNIPNGVTIENTVIIVKRGNINFNGNNHALNNVAIVANNGGVNLANTQVNNSAILASRSINLNNGARFSGESLIAAGSQNIIFNGATTTTDEADFLTVIAQGDIIFNGASATRGEFLTAKNFISNNGSELIGSIGAKGNAIFNNNATVTAIVSDQDSPIITGQLANDTGVSDGITSNPTISGTVTDDSTITELTAGFGSIPVADYVDILSELQSDGSFTLSQTMLEQINGAPLANGDYVLNLQAVDQFGNTSNFTIDFSLDTTAPNLDIGLDPASDTDPVGDGQTTAEIVTLTGQSDPGAQIELIQTGQTTTADGTGAYAFTNVALALGDNSFDVKATDIAGNETTISPTFTRLPVDADPPVITGQLANDTAIGGTNGDGITSDPTITGTVTDASNIDEFIAGFGDIPVGEYTGLIPELLPDGSFNLDQADLETINGAPLVDGDYTLNLQATDEFGNASGNVDIAFTLDTTPPAAPTLELDPVFDTEPLGDGRTIAEIVTLTGQGDPNTQVRLVQTNQVTATDSTGQYTFTDVPLILGENTFDVIATDIAGNEVTTTQTFTRLEEGTLILQEGQSFQVDLTESLDILEQPAILTFTYDDDFDLTDTAGINDALEVAIVDANGDPLVQPFATGRDAFFNLTEGEGAAFSIDASLVDKTVTLNLPAFTLGQTTNLIFELINNDSDTQTTFTISDIAILPGGTGTSTPVTPTSETPVSADIDFSSITEVTPSLEAKYGRTSYVNKDKVLSTEVSLENIGQYDINGPLLVAIDNLSDPTVQVQNFDGVTPDGIPYFDFTNLINEQGLAIGSTSDQRTLSFFNPNESQFTYNLRVLASTNRSPDITSEPGVEAFVDRPYTYQVQATDPDNDQLTYELLAAPDGMAIDASTGAISWTPIIDNVGNYTVTVQVSDGNGGITEQSYNLGVLDGNRNRPPLFTSTPIVQAAINAEYTYQATASDPDQDGFIFSVVDAPDGLAIDADTGLVTWTPTGEQAGTFDVTLQVTDVRGGEALQTYKIFTAAEEGNNAPIIISEPQTDGFTATGYVQRIEAIDPDDDALSFTLTEAPTGMAIDPETGWISWTTKPENAGAHDISVMVDDGRGGFDNLSFTLDLSSEQPGQIWGRVFYDSFEPPEDLLNQPQVFKPRTNNRLTPPELNSGNVEIVDISYQDPTFGIDSFAYDDTTGQLLATLVNPPGLRVGLGDIVALEQDGSLTQIVSATPEPGIILGRDGFAVVPEDFIGDFNPGDKFVTRDFLVQTGLQKITTGESGFEFEPDFADIGGPPFSFTDDPNTTSQEIQRILFDETGLFGGDLITSSWYSKAGTAGFNLAINRVNSEGEVSNIANVEISTSVVSDIVPNDLSYGPLAGKILATYGTTLYTIDPSGVIEEVPYIVTSLIPGDLEFKQAGFRLVEPNQNLVANHFAVPSIGLNPGVSAIGADYFQPYIGDLMALRDGGGGSRSRLMYWDGENVRIVQVPAKFPPLDGGLANGTFSEDRTFAPVAIGDIPAVEPLSLANEVVFIDENDNNLRDSGEIWTTTDDNGIYNFNLAPGDYKVVQEVQEGFEVTSPESDNYNLTLASGEVLTGNNFGNVRNFIVPPAPDENEAPEFITNGPNLAQVDERILYRPQAIDLDGDLITFDLVSGPEGLTFDIDRNIMAWRATADQVGTETVIIRATDARGAVTLQEFEIEVVPQNLPPRFYTVPPATSQAAIGQNVQFLVEARTPESDPLTFILEPDGTSATVVDEDPRLPRFNTFEDVLFKWQPNTTGIFNFSITADDGEGGTAATSFQIEVVDNLPNDAPTLNIEGLPRITTQAIPYVGTVIASDPDNDPLEYRLTEAPTGMTIEPNGNIFWAPQPDQVGTHIVTVEVDDGRGGIVSDTYELTVASTGTIPNTPPFFVSDPRVNATANLDYEYQIEVNDTDIVNDNLLLTLDTAPDGMFLDPATSRLLWTPGLNDIGTNNVVIRVTDSQGAFELQEFTVTVNAVNIPPIITSAPITEAAQDKAYSYLVQAEDSDNGQLSYELINAPTGMIIDPGTGLIEWTPTATDLGNATIEVRVDDGQGGIATQTYDLLISDTAANLAPAFTSQPIYAAAIDEPYTYQATASDPEDGTLTFSLGNSPTDMTIDANTGLIEWTPTTDQTGDFSIEVIVTDPDGATATQSFVVSTIVNSAPVILSTPATGIQSGDTYLYNLRVEEPDGDPLTYTLTEAPEGMTIDNLGRLRWDVPLGLNVLQPVTITVADNRGASVQQSFDIAVSGDDQAPVINLSAPFNVNINEPANIVVTATDNIRVTELLLIIDGESITLDANGVAEYTPTQSGVFTAQAIATDAAGNMATVEQEFGVIDPTMNNAPDISLDVIEGTEFTAPEDIIGSVLDDDLTSYSLSVAPLDSDNFTEIASGSDTVNGAALGEFDPTVLQNDTYTLRLEATDVAGNIAIVDRQVNVVGELKLGNFRLSFTDLQIPVTGIPITVTRTYDSLTSKNSDDFGFGWRMEFRDTDLRTSLGRDEVFEQLGIRSEAYQEGTKVFITLPGGDREVYTFKPERDPLSNFFPPVVDGEDTTIYRPAFESEAGSYNTLTVKDTRLTRSNGKFIGLGGQLYNPADGFFGGTFVLTTKEGIVYEIDGNTGDLLTVTDRNGNQLTFTDAGVESSTGKQVVFERNAQGRITALIDPAGNRITYDYDANGDLIAVTDRENNQTEFQYNEPTRDHFLTDIIDPLDRPASRTEYDDKGRLKQILDVNGESVEMTYDPDNSLQIVKDKRGFDTVYEYDNRGNVVKETDPVGKVTERTYDADNNILTEKVITDESGSDGFVSKFTYDSRGNVLTETDPLDRTNRYTYNSFNQLSTIINPLGHTTSYEYDSRGNLTAETDATGYTRSYIYDPVGRVKLIVEDAGRDITEFNYDSFGNLSSLIDALGHETTLTYDENGNPLTETRTQTTPEGERTLTTTVTYDNDNRVTSVLDAEDNLTRFEYDGNGNRTVVIDPLGRRTEQVYDDLNRPSETIFPDGTPGDLLDNLRLRNEYDVVGNRTAIVDPSGKTTNYVYNPINLVTETISPDDTPGDLSDNQRILSDYNQRGLATGLTDEDGDPVELIYDAAGQLVGSSNTLNDSVTTVYDAAGRSIATTDPLGRTTLFDYDELDRVTRVETPDGESIAVVYDQFGNVTSLADQAGRSSQYEYDVLDRLVAVTDENGERTEYSYDELGNLIQQKDANDRLTKYEYDRLSRRIAVERPLGQREEMSYDEVGRVDRITNFNGDVIEFEYDELDRLRAKNYVNESRLFEYTYYDSGQLATYADDRGITTYNYDDRNRLASRLEPDGTEISYTYVSGGAIESITTPTGTTSYTYDEVNRIDTISKDGEVTDYEFDDAGNLVQIILANGVTETMSYDDLNRLVGVTNTDANGNILSSYIYTLDELGNRTRVEESSGRIIEFTYDDLYRLTQETITDPVNGDRTITYTYDEVGNRLSRDDSIEGLTTYTYDDNDRLLTSFLNGVETTYAYDDNGNLLSANNPDRQVVYDWDAMNQLVGADITDVNGIKEIDYKYDASGIRVASIVDGEETRFLIDTTRPYPEVLEEYAPNGDPIASYVHGLDLISQERNGESLFYLSDAHSGVRQLSDDLGGVVSTYDYDAYGNLLNSTGTATNNYLYRGEQFDPNLDLQYLRARYYDPNLGRFPSVDPFEGDLENPMSKHRYQYGFNNPISYIDPTGAFNINELVASQTIQSILEGSDLNVAAETAIWAGLALSGLTLSLVQKDASYYERLKNNNLVYWEGEVFATGLNTLAPIISSVRSIFNFKEFIEKLANPVSATSSQFSASFINAKSDPFFLPVSSKFRGIPVNAVSRNITVTSNLVGSLPSSNALSVLSVGGFTGTSPVDVTNLPNFVSLPNSDGGVARSFAGGFLGYTGLTGTYLTGTFSAGGFQSGYVEADSSGTGFIVGLGIGLSFDFSAGFTFNVAGSVS